MHAQVFTYLLHYLIAAICAPSFQVAAKVKSDDEKDEWFVVKVIHFDKETKEYVYDYMFYFLPCIVQVIVCNNSLVQRKLTYC